MEYKIAGPEFEIVDEHKAVHCLAAKSILRGT